MYFLDKLIYCLDEVVCLKFRLIVRVLAKLIS